MGTWPTLARFAWVLLLLPAGAQAVQKATPKSASPVVGHLKWKVIESKTGKVLAHGDRQIYLRDVILLKTRGGTKGISLGNHFYMGRPIQPEPTAAEMLGFGLTLENDDPNAFSWDWFNVTSPTHATKLQEGGELGIKITKGPGGYDIGQTDFLTDVWLRGSLLMKDAPGTDRWRALISKGSKITWPVLRNGKLVLK